MEFFPYTLVGIGQRLTASFMSLKGSYAQIHSATAELGIVDWKATNVDGGFREKKNITLGD